MILDLENVSTDERISGNEAVVFHDVSGEQNRIDCHIEVHLRKIGETFYIHVDLSGEFSTACHKCLEPASHKVTPAFEIVVQRTGPHSKPDQVPGGEEYVRLPWGESRFSLDQHIYENLIVNIPMKITCREDCRGLCSGCGVNLNREACKCAPETDARWNKLKGLRDNLPE